MERLKREQELGNNRVVLRGHMHSFLNEGGGEPPLTQKLTMELEFHVCWGSLPTERAFQFQGRPGSCLMFELECIYFEAMREQGSGLTDVFLWG